MFDAAEKVGISVRTINHNRNCKQEKKLIRSTNNYMTTTEWRKKKQLPEHMTTILERKMIRLTMTNSIQWYG